MADIKQCQWVIPHHRHNWMEQSILPYGHRQYHHCEGVEGMSGLDNNTLPSYDSSIQQGGNMSDAVKVLRKEIARSKIEGGTVESDNRTLTTRWDEMSRRGLRGRGDHGRAHLQADRQRRQARRPQGPPAKAAAKPAARKRPTR